MLKILVACHRPHRLPHEEPYLPIEVGAQKRVDLHLGGVRDNEGINISQKNPNYCELTALYWARHNLPETVTAIGLTHYRRYFGIKKTPDPLEGVFSLSDWNEFLKESPVILPPKRNYFIETVESQYVHAHHSEDIETLRSVLAEKHSEYLPAFEKLMRGRKTHILNMFVMRRDLFNQYCDWLFDVLFEVEKLLDISSYSANDARVFGFLSERLLDVWLETNHISYIEKPVIHTEKINWIKKGSSFILRKLGIKR